MAETTADKLQKVLNTKEGIKGVIKDNGGTPPSTFAEYPTTLDNIMDNMRNQLKLVDRIVMNKDTTLAQINSFFNFVPIVTKNAVSPKVTAKVQLNVRSAGNGNASYLGYLAANDTVNVIGTDSTGWYKIQTYRAGSDASLKTQSTTGYISNNTSYVTYTNGVDSKKIDVSALAGTIQKQCNYLVAQTKNWEVIFDDNYKPSSSSGSTGSTGGTGTVSQTVDYACNNYFTDQYKDSTYTSFSNTVQSEVRQGYYSGYYYYKGNMRFTSARLTEMKNLLNNSTVTISSVQVYVQRKNSSHGQATATLTLYACDSTGKNADVLINGTTTLNRGAGTWTTLSTAVINGFKNGTYDHFKVYKNSTSLAYYMVFDLVTKVRITYKS